MKRYGCILFLFTIFLAGIPLQKALSVTSKTIRFQITNGVYTDEALLGFFSAALDEYDPYDSHKLSNDNASFPEIYFIASGSEVAINGVPPLIANKSIALGFRTGTAGSFSIHVTEFNNLDAGTTVILKDNLLSVEQNLTQNPTYTFTSVISTTSTRFTLFISKPLAKIAASDRAVNDQFGSAVAVSGEYAVVGNDPADSTGSAYIFKLTSGTWSQVQKITASDIASNDHFGSAVAICGDYLVVGAYGEDGDATGGNTLSSAGSAYIFRNDAGTWTQVQKIVASDRAVGDCFGQSVSISGNHILIGALNEDEDASGGNSLTDAGAAYIFRNTSGAWSQSQKIVASDRAADDHFGNQVSVSGKTLMVSAIDEDEDAAGTNTLPSAGSAYLFQNTAETWSQSQKLVASDRAANDKFGSSISLSGEYAVVGASDEDEDASGSNTATSAGSAYIFKNTAGTWSQAQKIVASDRAANDKFGSSAAISGSFILIGAFQEDEDVTGGNTLSSAGSAYLFKNKAGTWSQNQKIIAADREVNDQFGYSVGFSGKNGIIGNRNDSHDAAGNNGLSAAGSATLIRLEPPKRTWNGSSWGTAPTAADSAVVNGTYNGAGFSCMDLVVNAGKNLSIHSDLNVYGSMTLKSDVTNGKSCFVDNDHNLFVATRINVEQYLTGAGGSTPSGRFWYFSSPLKDATSSGFDLSSSNPLSRLWSFSESACAYSPIASTVLLNPGNGYVAHLGANKTVTLTGSELNTGDQSIPVTRTGATNTKRGFNLVGNPYSSFVELDPADNTSLESTIWYRSLSTAGTGMVFDTYNLTGNTSVVASGSGTLTRYIPPMQAFWIKVTAEGTSQIVFRNAKRSQQTGVALRAAETKTIRLQLTDGIQTDETLIGFYPDAKNAFDPYDSHKMSNENALFPEIFTLAGTEEVAINGLPPTEEIELPLGFRTGKAGTFTLKMSECTNSETTITLNDRLLNTSQDLIANPSYTFRSDIANTTERFSLLFHEVATNSSIVRQRSIEAFRSAGNHIQVFLHGLDEKQTRIIVYDTMGRSITESLAAHTFQPGVYIVKVTSDDFQAQKKVLITH